ncbi:hypothetical protein MVEN_00195300 [Mycena venus]|uniref:Uncharacterized protein n=1 Tax=Mycena venus TaxID=2733690 RepID=A0A8H6Z2J5_9AGAR|nr:hypothetical protein MVEN_00195300 [Mycena venus]
MILAEIILEMILEEMILKMILEEMILEEMILKMIPEMIPDHCTSQVAKVVLGVRDT